MNKEQSSTAYNELVASKDFYPEFYGLKSTPVVKIDSIEPAQGYIYGETRVLVRVGPLTKWEDFYPDPVCRFGNETVVAQYVNCHATY